MASKFPEYTLPKGSAVIRPDEKAFAALETAGRRIGPLYNSAAGDYTQIGKLRDEAFRAQDFPLDFAAFGASNSSGGINFKVSNPGAGFGGTTDGGGGGRSPREASSGRGYTPQSGRTTRSAAELISTWAGNTPDIAPNILRGGRGPENAQGGPVDVGQGGLTDPFSPGYADAQQQPLSQSNWNYDPGAVIREDLPGSSPAPAAPPASGGWWDGIVNGVSSAVSSVGTAISSDTGGEGVY